MVPANPLQRPDGERAIQEQERKLREASVPKGPTAEDIISAEKDFERAETVLKMTNKSETARNLRKGPSVLAGLKLTERKLKNALKTLVKWKPENGKLLPFQPGDDIKNIRKLINANLVKIQDDISTLKHKRFEELK